MLVGDTRGGYYPGTRTDTVGNRLRKGEIIRRRSGLLRRRHEVKQGRISNLLHTYGGSICVEGNTIEKRPIKIGIRRNNSLWPAIGINPHNF